MRRRPGSGAQSGFTLLEVMLAVGIGVIFMGGAVVFLSSTGGDKDLARAREIFEIASGAAREKALQHGKEQRVILGVPGERGLMDWLKKTDPDAYKDWSFPTDVQVNLLTPADLAQGRRGWAKPDEYQWLFTGSGLVEPIRVRLRHGENTEQFSFAALTGETLTEKPDRR